ncbi:hypothetical protein KM043_010737 [Ampulex compressa]|nr:hypothetical protein KM043_010737 [Ampulex compressa]
MAVNGTPSTRQLHCTTARLAERPIAGLITMHRVLLDRPKMLSSLSVMRPRRSWDSMPVTWCASYFPLSHTQSRNPPSGVISSDKQERWYRREFSLAPGVYHFFAGKHGDSSWSMPAEGEVSPLRNRDDVRRCLEGRTRCYEGLLTDVVANYTWRNVGGCTLYWRAVATVSPLDEMFVIISRVREKGITGERTRAELRISSHNSRHGIVNN